MKLHTSELARGASSATALALAGTLGLVAAPAASASTLGESQMRAAAARAAHEQVRLAAQESWATNPGDFVAQERAIVEAGGDSVSVTVPAAGLVGVSAAEAQQAYDDAVEAANSGEPSPLDVPVDAFDVSGTWFHSSPPWGEFWEFAGQWNFRDSWAGYSAPDEVSGIGASIPSCWQWSSDSLVAWDPLGNQNAGVYRQSAGAESSVWGIRDQGPPPQRADHGTHTLTFERVSSGCSGEDLLAAYYYEHNQEGSGSWSASISLGVMSVSYGGSGGTTLQKSTPVVST